MRKLISVVIPAYNEEANLDELARRLNGVMDANSKYDFEIIIVENGSIDSSFEKLVRINQLDARFKIVRLSRNFLPNNAIVAGLKYAKGDAAFIIYSDLQDPPEMIPQFIQKWEDGYEIVYGIIKAREGLPLTRKLMYSMFYKLIHRLTYETIPENASDFKLIDRNVYLVINQMDERDKFLRGIIPWTGFKQIGIPYKRAPRFAGESKADIITVFKFATNGVVSFSHFPLQIATVFGFIISFISFIMIIVEFVLFLLQGRAIPGIATTILVMLFSFGLSFLLLGIIGVYIGKIFDEVKKRPDYIVKNEIGFEDSNDERIAIERIIKLIENNKNIFNRKDLDDNKTRI